MVCLEFDMKDLPIFAPPGSSQEEIEAAAINKKYRVINQQFIETNFQFRINGNCHG